MIPLFTAGVLSSIEIDDECGVDLGQHGGFGVADKALDLQVLLDETEEALDLPEMP